MSRGKVLVIDDAKEMASAVVEYLQRNGFEAEGVPLDGGPQVWSST